MREQFKKVLISMIKSHSKLAQAEYNRDTSYNNEHFSYKAEQDMINYLQEHNPDVLQMLLD